MEYAATSTKMLQPQPLPSTEREQPSFTAYVSTCRLGWEIKNGVLAPVMTDLDPAPEEFLKFVRCKCKVKSKSPCSTKLCSCLKHGLTCVTACSGFRECSNVSEATPDEEE